MKGDLIGLDTPTMGNDDGGPPKRFVGDVEARWHGFAFLLITLASVGMLGILFTKAPCTGAADADGTLILLMIAVVAGLLGGLVHAVSSFTDFAGNRQLMTSWIPWLYLRAPVGSLIAVIVYFVLRRTPDEAFKTCEAMYNVALSAALAGLFSKQVTDKLSDLVENIFVPSKPTIRKDPLKPKVQTDEAAAGRPGTETFDETIQAAQRILVELGYLEKTSADGKASDDGLLDDATRAAVDAFLTHEGITGDDRTATLGDDHEPDFWPRLLELLEVARKR